LLGALALAQQDAERGRLDDKRLDNIIKTVTAVVEDLGDRDGPMAGGRKSAAETVDADEQDNRVLGLRSSEPAVICLPGLGRLDEAAAIVVTGALDLEGIKAHAASAETLSGAEAKGAILCVCFLEELSEARRRYTMRRLVRGEPAKVIVLALFGANSDNPSEAEPQPEKRFKTAYTLRATVAHISAMIERNRPSSV
jgi:hypothetical protein